MLSLHVEGLAWLRYGLRCPIVSTEVGPWRADVMGIKNTACYEIEVKKSISDLRNENRSKGTKHYLYANVEPLTTRFVPNYFYVFVPTDIEEAALAYVQDNLPHAGLAVLRTEAWASYSAGRGVVVVRKARKLHKNKPSVNMIQTGIWRMSSEICGLRIALDGLKKSELTEPLVQELARLASRIGGALDPEASDLDLATRAAELVQVVTGESWQDLFESEQKTWIERARQLGAYQRINFEGLPLDQID